MGRRRRTPIRKGGNRSGASYALAQVHSDLRYVEQLVTIPFPLHAARAYLQRYIGNVIQWKLVEARRGESVGVVREIEIHHASGERTRVTGERRLANGSAASFYVPDHLVTTVAVVVGAASQGRPLHKSDRIVLHVPVRGYLRFLPQIFQGEGPVQSRMLTRTRDAQLQRWRSGDLPEQEGVDVTVDEDPLRRFLFIFQHVMSTLSDQIDRLVDLTDPLRCDSKMLPWLASWVGFQLDESLPVHQQRELVRNAIRLMRSRGTRLGIEEMVRVLTSAPVRIEERQRPGVAVLGKNAIVGGRTAVERFQRDEPPGAYLMAPEAYSNTSFFTLRLEPRERFRARFGERAAQVLRRICNVVSAERPTHVSFVIRFDERR